MISCHTISNSYRTHVFDRIFGQMASISSKIKRDQARRAIDIVINESLFSDSKTERPGQSNRHNINSSFITYAAALQNNPHFPQFNSYNHHKMRINAIFQLTTTSKTEHLFPSSTTKRKSIHLQYFPIPTAPLLPHPSQMTNPLSCHHFHMTTF